MNFIDLVLRRRSCRRYLSRPIPRESLERCLEAARFAPSACNSQPWRFIVVDNPELKNKIARQAFSGIFAMNQFASQAPVLIVVIRERSKYVATLGGTLRDVQYSLIDIGIAVEHLVLQAEEEGLGTCWLGWFDEGAVKRNLGLPRHVKVDILISLGYPQDSLTGTKNRKATAQVWEFR
jgi:nitroreductase